MIAQSQNSSSAKSGRGVPARFQYRAGFTAALYVVMILALLFSVQLIFLPGSSQSDIAGQGDEFVSDPSSFWLGETQIEETEEYYLVRMSIPEIEKEKLEIVLDSGVLKVTGKKSVFKAGETRGWLSQSEMQSSFQKTCKIPSEVELEIADTKVEKGFLIVKIPKANS